VPLYTYRCDQCGYQFDDLAPMDSVSHRPCEASDAVGTAAQCHGTARRVPSLPAPAQFNCDMSHLYRRPKK
jgi:putative FmdB family regulatory protein